MEEDDAQPRPQVAAQIDENLKRVYTEMAGDEVPDRFKQLLEELKKKEAGAKA